jgi:hypothetical protein
MSTRRGAGIPHKLSDKDGNKYDFDKNTVNGIPPLEVGDVFFYRGKGSPAATVTKVRVRDIQGRMALLDQLSASEESDFVAQMWVDLTRVEVVQRFELKPAIAPETAPEDID